MATHGPVPVSVTDAVATLTFLSDRSPATTPEQAQGAFAQVAGYREGGIFVGHWAGTSEWERHAAGEEIVMVVDGSTTIFFLTDEGDRSARLGAGQLVVVPAGTWHRFETPDQVKVLAVTPQPTDHSTERPA